MSDRVEEAIESYEMNKNRIARGTVDGHQIYLTKKRGLLRWKLIIEVDGSREYKRTGPKEGISADFEYYKDQHDLEEVPMDRRSPPEPYHE